MFDAKKGFEVPALPLPSSMFLSLPLPFALPGPFGDHAGHAIADGCGRGEERAAHAREGKLTDPFRLTEFMDLFFIFISLFLCLFIYFGVVEEEEQDFFPWLPTRAPTLAVPEGPGSKFSLASLLGPVAPVL